jgi:hypothetical protein
MAKLLIQIILTHKKIIWYLAQIKTVQAVMWLVGKVVNNVIHASLYNDNIIYIRIEALAIAFNKRNQQN